MIWWIVSTESADDDEVTQTHVGVQVPGLDLRVIERNGEPWFIAKDVCDALGLDTVKGTGPRLAHLDPEETFTVNLNSIDTNRGNKAGNPRATIINESGLYALILRSRKPEAKAFKKWVTSEVLPAIRKTGGYMVPVVANLAETDPAAFLACVDWVPLLEDPTAPPPPSAGRAGSAPQVDGRATGRSINHPF